MAIVDSQSLRLAFKRAFTNYYLALLSPGIADPSEAFAEGYEYLYALREQLGHKEFMFRLDDETVHMAGEIEQDLRRRAQKSSTKFVFDLNSSDNLEDRLRECFETALEKMNPYDVFSMFDDEGSADFG